MKDLEFRRVSFSYGEKQVLKDVNLRFPAGRISLLMGPSGIGKTTVFRLAAGLIQPQAGQILGLPEDGAGVLFQEDRLFRQLSVLDNLRICAPERTDSELLIMMEELGLKGEERRRVQELSGGMRRRIALLRAAAVKRELYLLDEPFNGLDEKTKEKAVSWLLRQLSGKTAVIITHQASDAQLLGGNIFRLNEKGESKC